MLSVPSFNLMLYHSFGIGDLLGCRVVSGDGHSVLLVVVVKCYSGGSMSTGGDGGVVHVIID